MRAIAIIGPSQSGKTTLAGALAGLEGQATQSFALMGDASLTTFQFMGDDWAVLDVPGGQDNLCQIGPVLAACDAAVLCVPPDTDAAVLAAPYLRLLEETGMPTFVFVNKIDASADRVADIAATLQQYCQHKIVLRQIPIREGDEIVGAVDLISERAWEYREQQRSMLTELPEAMRDREQEARADLLESLADFDDSLLEQIVEDQRPLSADLYKVATNVLQHHDLVPALLGSASHGNGIQRLMKSLRHEVPRCDAIRERLALPEGLAAVGCLADHLKHVGKTVLIRALGERVNPGDRLGGAAIGSLNGPDGRKSLTSLGPGEFGFTVKSDHLRPGRFYTAEDAIELPGWARAHPPALHRLVQPEHERDQNKLSAALARLTEIDPGLTVAQDEMTGHLDVGFQGTQHMKRFAQKLSDAFGIEAAYTELPTALRETIRKGVEIHHRHRKQSGGAGQFADVVIEVQPMPNGGGFVFSETVKGGAVPRNYIPSVEAGARDALAKGPAGYPVVDVSVVLKDGKSHAVDSSDFAFRTAGQNAVREALAKSGTAVLQPIMKVVVQVPSVFSGDLVQLVSSLKGQVLGFEGHPTALGWDEFRALLPMMAIEDLTRALSSTSRGTAWLEKELDHYEEMREPIPAPAH